MHRTGSVLFRTLALASLLTLARPAAAAEDESPRRFRTSAEIFTFLALDFTLLHFSPPPAADPPGNVSLADKLTFKAWSFDASSFPTNFAAHPLAGTFYYTTARSNRSSPLESLGWASLASLTWELAEYPENVSFNDLIVTPVAGASIGEPLVQLSQWLDRGPRSTARSVFSTLLFPMKLLNGAPTPDDDDGELAADLRVVSGARLGSGPELGVHVSTRLIHLPGFGQAGDGGHFGAGANVSGLSLDVRGSRSGLTDFRFSSGMGLFTLYRRSIEDDGRGWDFLASGGVGYDIRQHSWDAGPMDGWSSVHVPGLQLQLRRMDGPFRLTLRTDLALTFGGARSFLLDGAPYTFAQESLTTTQRAWGYTLGWGIAAAPSIEVAYGPVALDLGAAIDTRYALNRPDPWVDRHPDANLSDSWSSFRAGIRVKLPWNDLQVSSSIERNLRRGSGNGTSRSAGETLVLAGVGFSL